MPYWRFRVPSLHHFPPLDIIVWTAELWPKTCLMWSQWPWSLRAEFKAVRPRVRAQAGARRVSEGFDGREAPFILTWLESKKTRSSAGKKRRVSLTHIKSEGKSVHNTCFCNSLPHITSHCVNSKRNLPHRNLPVVMVILTLWFLCPEKNVLKRNNKWSICVRVMRTTV